MTCQHCQTWVLDGEHRCGRCGRRVRSTPSRISPHTFPIAAAATARAYDFDSNPDLVGTSSLNANTGDANTGDTPNGQQRLFTTAPDPRIIPFTTLTSPAGREAIRLRAADTQRPAPLTAAKVEGRRSRTLRPDSVRQSRRSNQHRLEFAGQEYLARDLGAAMPADALVATASLRVQAALLDALFMVAGCLIGVVLFVLMGGQLTADRHVLPFLAAALLTVPLFYKLLWIFAGHDSLGTQMAGLELVDFDGKGPSRERRYGRLFGSLVSFLAAGIGMIWALVDEDKLTWHDHMSGTFPTLSGEKQPG